MRPSRLLLLVSANPENLAVLAYTLRQNRPASARGTYHVDTAASAQEALTALADGHYDLMLIDCPLDCLDELVERAKLIEPGTPILCIDHSASPIGYVPVRVNMVLLKPTTAELLNHVRLMTASKRGPRKGFKIPRPEAEWFRLGEKTA